MTNVVGIDATSQAWQPDNTRSSAKDFAHELAKHDAEQKPAAQAKSSDQDNAKSTAEDDPDMHESVVAPSLVTANTSAEAAFAAVQGKALTEAQQLAQAPVAPTGVTEALLGARVFGWHALAQAYLSELTAADEGQLQQWSHEGGKLSSQGAMPEEDAEPSTGSILSMSRMAEAEEVSVVPQAETITQMEPRLASDETAPSNIAELSTADASAASYWPERSLRFTRQRDGTSVAWLRDFRIGDGEASHLIQFVLNDAKANGFTLSKIMLNGREAWASSNGNT